MSRAAIVHLSALVLGLTTASAGAQPQPQPQPRPQPAQARRSPADLRAELAAVKKELEELRAMAVQAPTLAQSVQELTTRVTALEGELGRLRRQQAAGPEVVESLDRLTLRVDAAGRDVERLRTQLAGIEQPEVAPGPGEAGWDGAFEWIDGTGDYSLRLGGFVQPRVQVLLPQDADSITQATFLLRRARLVGGGHLGSDALTYRFHLQAETGDASALDYVLDYRFAPWLAVRAGQGKVPFTRSWLASDQHQDVYERPAAIEALRYDRDAGVWAHGALLDDRLAYWIGLSNGAGPNRLNDNIDFLSALRLDAALVGDRFEPLTDNFSREGGLRLMVGGGLVHDLVRLPERVAGIEVANRDVDANGTADNVRVWSASLDASMRIAGLELVLEGIWRHERWGTILQHSSNAPLADLIEPSGRGRTNYLGGYLHASYVLVPAKLQVGARLGHNRVPLLGVGGRSLAAVPPGNRLVEGTLQLRYEWSRSLALGGSYSLFNYNASEGPDPSGDISHLFIGQAQLNF